MYTKTSMLLDLVCKTMELEDVFCAKSFRFEVELLQGVDHAFSRFREVITEELSDSQMWQVAELLAKSPHSAGEELKDVVKLLTGREKKAVALLLRALHPLQRESWHVPAARRLLSGDEETIPKWLLEHAVLWWPDLLPKSSKLQDFLQKVQLNYCASCSPSDLLARQLLINTAQHFSQTSPLEVWSFRSWAQLLKPWTSSSWENLDQRRVRATTEDFAFDTQKRTLAEDKADEKDAYDIAYLLPFLVGQLRLTYQESHQMASQSLGATLSAVMCGGALEVLLLATACSDEMLRACAFEALSIVVAMSHYWNVTSFEKDEWSTGGKRLPFRELPELVRLLCYVRDGLPTPEDDLPPTLPRLAASFYAACVPILIQPQHVLYHTLAKYLFGKPAADVQDVPLFHQLLSERGQ
eukprot:symbB.v1.2.008808.t2/scaffold536.1/size343967/24